MCKNKPEPKHGVLMAEERREVRGRIPKDLKKAFEIACVHLETTQTEALEEAIRDWLRKNQQPSASDEQ